MSSEQLLQQAQSTLWLPGALDEPGLVRVMDSMLAKGADFADLYFEKTLSESWSLEDGIVKDGSFNVGGGVGVRALCGEKTGFSYSDQADLASIQRAASAAATVANGKGGRCQAVNRQHPAALYNALNPLDTMGPDDKIALLQSADQLARRLDPGVVDVSVSLAGSWKTVLVLASDGTLAADVRPLVRFSVSVVLQKNGRKERGNSGGGGRVGYEQFDAGTVARYVEDAVKMAQVNLDAIDAPAGTMPVVLGSGWPGVLLHEAVGHGLEGDFNRKGTSNYSGRIGSSVASPLCTIVDDGTLLNRRGSLSIDDEGTPTQHTTLVEKGILKGYMQDKHNARLMGQALTGNGRRESYSHLPMPRMTNTYLLPGEDEPDDIIRSVKKGLYAVNFGGGQVDITSGKFVFAASEAYLIEDGKITAPVKGATLIGNGPQAMSKVSMLGNDLALDNGVGTCGKEGQSVPVGVGQPTLKVDELVVGGTR
ncbi:MAG: metalloprotease TldD [Alcanivorax sp.]|mgnify:FL=1|jgi:TldD protein|uniref:metalloprotease TldD n=1 Tax=unclassified Ketobacter TaxID=2639109 RepID=UPI000C36DD3E|nr:MULTISPECIES: metalloprotease TldD [unclassified Ketobacter]MBI25872.1 metalloprotease TldD [Pseudomonadales bacterium]TNC88628.1 MAG: metalloprotease TldD [Alcanivorax sp.]HAU12091.1 metalloprotease TldD [Gammaproteobacteria bacterium]RLT91326.1 MAG: metalloprotease TldD [Ketobacter sp. GenoA1]RLT98239.1 MAG: metalloprotease TldD [Ketobacter sp.]|tara:strand:- start:2442 stop:3881 length:1440 start_codon:yes stop_codon:yes gene_type:complete